MHTFFKTQPQPRRQREVARVVRACWARAAAALAAALPTLSSPESCSPCGRACCCHLERKDVTRRSFAVPIFCLPLVARGSRRKQTKWKTNSATQTDRQTDSRGAVAPTAAHPCARRRTIARSPCQRTATTRHQRRCGDDDGAARRVALAAAMGAGESRCRLPHPAQQHMLPRTTHSHAHRLNGMLCAQAERPHQAQRHRAATHHNHATLSAAHSRLRTVPSTDQQRCPSRRQPERG